MYELINLELEKFVAAESRVEDLISKERDFLQKRVEAGNVSDKYIEHMNYLLGSFASYMEATEQLFQQIGFARQAMGLDVANMQALKSRVGELENENQKMRAWLKSMGKDISLLPYIRKSDYRYI